MNKYTTKPEEVEAELFDGNNNPFDCVSTHKCDYRMCPACGGCNEKIFYIKNGSEFIYPKPNTFIVKDNKGLFQWYDPDYFKTFFIKTKDLF